MTEVAKLDQIPESGGLAVEHDGQDIALFRDGDKIHAIDAICPHVGANLAEGFLENGKVACPLHGWEIDVCAGTCETTGEDHKVFEVEVKDGAVFIK